MYLTAHRILKRNTPKTGINAFLHRHDVKALPDIDWEDPNLDLVVNACPGRLVEKECDLSPGGNEVLSYLDVVSDDATTPMEIQTALDAFQNTLPGKSLPFVYGIGRIAVRFGAVVGLSGAEEIEYKALKGRALKLL